MSGLKNSKLGQAWLILLLSLIFGGALAAVQLTLGPQIEANKLTETRAKVPSLLLEKLEDTGTTLINFHDIVIEKSGQTVNYMVAEAIQDDEFKGWVIKASGAGYADKIELLFGVNPKVEKIGGIFILDQKETPGLGNKIVEEGWRNQFAQKPLDQPLVATKTKATQPNEIDAITGATISSVAVTDIINTAVADLRAPLQQRLEQKQ